MRRRLNNIWVRFRMFLDGLPYLESREKYDADMKFYRESIAKTLPETPEESVLMVFERMAVKEKEDALVKVIEYGRAKGDASFLTSMLEQGLISPKLYVDLVLLIENPDREYTFE